MTTTRALPLLLLLPFSGVALAQPNPCELAYKAEVSRIENDARAKRKGLSPEADQSLTRGVQMQLKLAAAQAKQCQAEGRRGPSPGVEKQCNDQAAPKLASLNQSVSGRNLSNAEFKAFTDAQERIKDEIRECMRRGR